MRFINEHYIDLACVFRERGDRSCDEPECGKQDCMGFESQQAVYKWQRGESLPSVDNFYALSRLFGTTMDDILVGYDTEGAEAPSDHFFPIQTIYVLNV